MERALEYRFKAPFDQFIDPISNIVRGKVSVVFKRDRNLKLTEKVDFPRVKSLSRMIEVRRLLLYLIARIRGQGKR